MSAPTPGRACYERAHPGPGRIPWEELLPERRADWEHIARAGLGPFAARILANAGEEHTGSSNPAEAAVAYVRHLEEELAAATRCLTGLREHDDPPVCHRDHWKLGRDLEMDRVLTGGGGWECSGVRPDRSGDCGFAIPPPPDDPHTTAGLGELRALVWDMLGTMPPSPGALAFAVRAGRLGVTDEQGRPLVPACMHDGGES